MRLSFKFLLILGTILASEKLTLTPLTLCGHRYYSPGETRWLTRDPIGQSGGINLYAYCQGRPVGNIDPSGFVTDKIASAALLASMAAATDGGPAEQAADDALASLGGVTEPVIEEGQSACAWTWDKMVEYGRDMHRMLEARYLNDPERFRVEKNIPNTNPALRPDVIDHTNKLIIDFGSNSEQAIMDKFDKLFNKYLPAVTKEYGPGYRPLVIPYDAPWNQK